jgi:hypothetical protein
MYYSYVEIEYVATSFSPARTDLALKLLRERDSRCFLCAAASVSKILTFFSGGRDSRCFLSVSFFWLIFGLCPQVKEIADIFVVQRHVGPKLVLFYRETKSLDIVSLLQNLFSDFV